MRAQIHTHKQQETYRSVVWSCRNSDNNTDSKWNERMKEWNDWEWAWSKESWQIYDCFSVHLRQYVCHSIATITHQSSLNSSCSHFTNTFEQRKQERERESERASLMCARRTQRITISTKLNTHIEAKWGNRITMSSDCVFRCIFQAMNGKTHHDRLIK